MPFAFIQSATGQGAFSATITAGVLSSTVTLGDKLIVCVQSILGQPPPTSVTDSAGNSYSQVAGSPFSIQAGGSPGRFIKFFVWVATAASTVGSLTVTLNGAGGTCADCSVLNYSNSTLTQDQTTGITSTTGSPLIETDSLSSPTTSAN